MQGLISCLSNLRKRPRLSLSRCWENANLLKSRRLSQVADILTRYEQLHSRRSSIFRCEVVILICRRFVLQERVLRCCELIQDMVMMGVNLPKTGSPAVLSVPQSPIGVLDAAWLSYSSEDSTVGSQETSYESSPTSKRRKISR